VFAIVAPGALAVPSIDQVIPPEAEFGLEELTVLIYGSNFTPDSVVTYNGQPVPTSYLGSDALQATLSAEVLQAPGTGGLAVVNGPVAVLGAAGAAEASAASTSAVAAFHVAAPAEAPLPSIDHMAPGSVLLGTAETWIGIVGHGFAEGETVARWNGQARDTVVLNSSELLMRATANDLNVPGNVAITAFSPSAGESDPVTFRVRPPGEKPVPVVASAVVLGAGGPRLYINGSDFDAGAQIYINGVARATTFVNDTQVSMAMGGSDPGGLITVVNPGPGGGASNVLAFVVHWAYLPVARR
jgi:hypothetical protein